MRLVTKKMKLSVLALIISGLLPGPQFAIAGSRTWLGSASSDWNAAANWSGAAVPGAGDNVTIPSGLAQYPVVSVAGAMCSQISFSGTNAPAPSLTIANGGNLIANGNLIMVAGASVMIHPGGTFTLNGNCNNTGVGLLDMDGGTFVFNDENLYIPANLTGGTVDFVRKDPHVGITNFYNLAYSGGGPAFTLAGNTTVKGNLDIAAGSQMAVNGYNVTANTLTLGSTTETAGAYNNGNASAYILGTTSYVTVSAGPAARLAFIIQPANVRTAQLMSNVEVRIQDVSGNNVACSNTPIAISLNSGAFAGGNTATNSDTTGAAAFSGLLINAAGNYTMTASASGLASTTSSFFTVSAPGSAGSIAGQPLLSIAQSGGGVTVSWANVSGWNLQQNSNLAAPAGWTACSGTVTVNGTNYLTIVSPTGSMFFRLHQ
ncbi:MAG TPA: hypothetical protein VGV18_02675 [Verrucomicrobiae bacterium]|nr:hypothetical protein [Verrucomicrobiae bacterium]